LEGKDQNSTGRKKIGDRTLDDTLKGKGRGATGFGTNATKRRGWNKKVSGSQKGGKTSDVGMSN